MRWVIGLGLVVVLGASAGMLLDNPAVAGQEPLHIWIDYNQQRVEVVSVAATVGEVIEQEFNLRHDLVVDPPAATPLHSGLVIRVQDDVPLALSETVAQNLAAALAPPPEPEPTPTAPAPIKAVVKKPAAEVAPPIDKPAGKAYSGLATWYRHGTELTTASRDFAKGTRIRVIAVNSGKSVDVVVNDYGPAISTGISLDLNAVAFAQLAPLGAGKIQIEYYPLD